MTKREADQIAKLITSALVDAYDSNGLESAKYYQLITEKEENQILDAMKRLSQKLSKGHNIPASSSDAIGEILYE